MIKKTIIISTFVASLFLASKYAQVKLVSSYIYQNISYLFFFGSYFVLMSIFQGKKKVPSTSS